MKIKRRHMHKMLKTTTKMVTRIPVHNVVRATRKTIKHVPVAAVAPVALDVAMIVFSGSPTVKVAYTVGKAALKKQRR